jgi:hypothetical protein
VNAVRKLLLAAILLVTPALAAQAQTKDDREAVRQAVLDYVEGIYDVDHTRIERSVHPEMAKRGFFVKKGESAYSSSQMTFAQLVELAKTYNKSGRVPKDAPKEIVIFDLLDQTATIKLTAVWGIDYMHLAKYEGKWKIINVLWQTHPKRGD